jgi:hypothetical protein
VKFNPVVTAVWIGEKLIDLHTGERTESGGFVRRERSRIAKRQPPVNQPARVAIDNWTVGDGIDPIGLRIEE